MNRHVLLIANVGSVWTRELVRNVHLPLGHRVSILSFDTPTPSMEAFFKATGVTLHLLNGPAGWREKPEKLRALLCFSFAHRGCYDLVILHGPPHSTQAYFLALALKTLGCPVLTVFWGSDIQAVTAKEARRLLPLLRCSKAVNLSTAAMRQAYQSFFPGMHLPVFRANFGLTAFQYIDRARETSGREGCLASLGLEREKLCIAVGYNGSKRQQHLAALRALAALPKPLREKAQLLIHMGYQLDAAYRDDVEKAAKETGFSCCLIDRELDLQEVAKLRVATDIMIHAQTNDALSGTIRECLYAGAVLVNPTWIRYEEYDRLGVSYLQYASFEELSDCVAGLLKGELGVDRIRNTQIMKENYSWEAALPAWQEAIEACMPPFSRKAEDGL